MKFETGMAGFLIVVLAVSGSIFGTILLNAEESTYEVTKYDFKTEVTGLFPVDTSPEFYDYDLARNYTGYFTPDTQINGVNYFGGASFRETTVNNYPVKFKPAIQPTTGTYNLNDYSLTTSSPPEPSRSYVELVFTDGTGFFSEVHAQSVTVSSIVSQLGLDGYDVIEITPISTDYSDNIFFGTTDRYFDQGSNRWFVNYSINNANATNFPPSGGFNPSGLIPWFSCKVDNITGQTSVYSSRTISQSAFQGAFNNDDVVLNYLLDGDSSGSGGAILGKSIKVTAYMNGIIQYMDISQGVTVTGGRE